MFGRRRRIALATISLVAVLGLAACGGDESADSSYSLEPAAQERLEGQGFVAEDDAGGGAQSDKPAAAEVQSRSESGSEPASDSGDKAASGANADPGSAAGSGPATADRRMVRTAQIDVRVKDVPAAAVKVRALATGLGGFVSSEDSALAPEDAVGRKLDESVATIVLRVPVARFDQAISRTGELGKVTSRTSASSDVTGQIIDLDSRISTQRASVARVRALMTQAKELKDVVLLESELSSRQAELESLEAQLVGLSDQADLSTLTVVLTEPADQAKAAEPSGDRGFLGALGDSWQALAATGSAILVLLGLLLPWLAVIGVVAVIALAIARRQRQSEAPEAPSGDAPAQPAPEAETPVGAGSTPS